jgi:hypothetical protein
MSRIAAGRTTTRTEMTSKPDSIRWDPPSAQPGKNRTVRFPLLASGTGARIDMLEDAAAQLRPD